MSDGRRHTVTQGESVESIAYAAGHLWSTVWEHDENSKLRELRKSPHVLHPGDEVFIPPLEAREEKAPAGQSTKFKRKDVPSKIEVRFMLDGQPRANASYTLIVGGEERTGTTDGDGWLKEDVHPLAARAEVRFEREVPEDEDYVAAPADDDAVHEGEQPEEEEEGADEPSHDVYQLDLRKLDPSSEVSGAQGRLHLLGYGVGAIDGELDDAVRQCLRAFQQDQGLDVTGELDDATQGKLAELTGG